MKTAIIQKLLFSITILTAFYLAFINLMYRDLTRKINKSIVQLIPGIIMIVVGYSVATILKNPEILFTYLFPIKSGFGRHIIGKTFIPLLAGSIQTIGVIAGQVTIIDKLLYYWSHKRLPYLISLMITAFLTITAGLTLFIIISAEKTVIAESTARMNIINQIATITLGVIIALLVLLNIIKYIKSFLKR